MLPWYCRAPRCHRWRRWLALTSMSMSRALCAPVQEDHPTTPSPETGLSLTRRLAVPRDLVREYWTSADQIPHWFMPEPHSVAACDIDLRVGGRFNTTMVIDGQKTENHGVWPEIVPKTRLVFTDTYAEGWVLAPDRFTTAMLDFADAPEGGMLCAATARCRSSQARQTHEDMDFSAAGTRSPTNPKPTRTPSPHETRVSREPGQGGRRPRQRRLVLDAGRDSHPTLAMACLRADLPANGLSAIFRPQPNRATRPKPRQPHGRSPCRAQREVRPQGRRLRAGAPP
jgi:uncharacterized protein YndB with AHSA1/START domain